MKKRRMKIMAILTALSLLCTGCQGLQVNQASIGIPTNQETGEDTTEDQETEGNEIEETPDLEESSTDLVQSKTDKSQMFTDRDYETQYDEATAIPIQLTGTSAKCESESVSISGGTVTIKAEGTYLITGSLEDGMIVVDGEQTDKTQLVLNGVEINNNSSAAIYVLQADKVVVTLASGSVNTLSHAGEYQAIDENNIDAVIFSKDDLTLNGEGRLKVTTDVGHGIVSKDDLVITSGTYEVEAASHGLSGKDSIRICQGTLSITSGKDGIHAENTEDTTLGFCYLAGGSYNLTAAGDGISATGYLQIDDGTYEIASGDGSSAQVSTTAYQTTETIASAKGIKSTGDLIINGGTFTVDSSDDALHTNSSAGIFGGTLLLSTGDDGVHADSQLVIEAGSITVSKSYEGLEGNNIIISGGNHSITSSDDGLNAAGGNDTGEAGGNWGEDRFSQGASDSEIWISGGSLVVNAGGDGVDSNGALKVSGGEVLVYGPENGANGALDYGSEAVITGGIFVAFGSSAMAQNFGTSSTQGAILVQTGTQTANSTAELLDDQGNVIGSWQSAKTYDSILISTPEIQQGSNYTVTAGSYQLEVNMESLIYGSGSGMHGQMGGGGRPSMGKGERGDKGMMGDPSMRGEAGTEGDPSMRREDGMVGAPDMESEENSSETI